ncbi:MAG: hypothetical protein JWP29_3250 [Rhodoferax sp.]|nr:hypothetical protein [Rhodoferax sp.]
MKSQQLLTKSPLITLTPKIKQVQAEAIQGYPFVAIRPVAHALHP